MLEAQALISARYRLLQRLRRGGMSEVYLAHDELTDQDVAIKLVSSDDEECLGRLRREVQTLRKLSHKHILPILDYGEQDSYCYLVMPYMKRGSLRELLLAQGKLTQEEAGKILAQVASALQCAHDQGILHRDIKPSNILLDDTDENYVYLADFGLAKIMGEGSDLTQTGCLIGTPEYMAPELATRPESVSSDIYALGILLYQMLTRRLPFTGNTPLAVYWKHLQEQPLPPSHLNAAISGPVEQVIMRAIAKAPEHRFLSASAMAREYADALLVSEASKTTAAQTFPPVVITLHKVSKPQLPAALQEVAAWWQRPRSKLQKGLVSLAAAVLLATPLSLGLLAARDMGHVNPVLSMNAVAVARTAPVHPRPKQTPPALDKASANNSVAPLNGSSGSASHTKHKHEKHGDEQGDGNGD